MTLRGIKFGDYHTADDWELILNQKSIGTPKPKTVYVQIEGRDGDLDLSEALTGEIKYENRPASFVFLLTEGSYEDRNDLISEILGAVHGKRLAIVDDDDPDHYLIGRCNVTGISNNRAYGEMVIECECEPWRYSVTETTQTVSASNTSKNVNLINSGTKTVIPEITVSNTVTLTIGSSSEDLTSGTYKLLSLILKTGVTTVTVKGSGTVTFKYREAVL